MSNPMEKTLVPKNKLSDFLDNLNNIYKGESEGNSNVTRAAISNIIEKMNSPENNGSNDINPFAVNNWKPEDRQKYSLLLKSFNDSSVGAIKSSTEFRALLDIYESSSPEKEITDAIGRVAGGRDNISSYGYLLAEELLDRETLDFFKEKIGSSESAEIIKTVESVLSMEAASVRAEIMSVIVTYCERTMDRDIEEGKIPKDFTADELLSRISELAFVVGKEKKNSKCNSVLPIISRSDNGNWMVTKAGSGVVDSIYKDPYDSKLVGTSTTLDTTGRIEKDQLKRHPYKVYRISNAIKEAEEANKNFANFSKELNDEIVEIQGWNSDKTYREMKEESNTGDSISEELIKDIYAEIEYNFDIFGDLVSPSDSLIVKLVKVRLFLRFQESQAVNGGYSDGALRVMNENIKQRVRYLSQNHKLDNIDSLLERAETLIIDIMEAFLEIEGYGLFSDKEVTPQDKANTVFDKVGDALGELIKNLSEEALTLSGSLMKKVSGVSENKITEYKPNDREIKRIIIDIIQKLIVNKTNSPLIGEMLIYNYDNLPEIIKQNLNIIPIEPQQKTILDLTDTNKDLTDTNKDQGNTINHILPLLAKDIIDKLKLAGFISQDFESIMDSGKQIPQEWINEIKDHYEKPDKLPDKEFTRLKENIIESIDIYNDNVISKPPNQKPPKKTKTKSDDIVGMTTN